MGRRIYIKFKMIPITRKGEKERAVIGRVDLAGEIIRHDGRAYLPLLCNIAPPDSCQDLPFG